MSKFDVLLALHASIKMAIYALVSVFVPISIAPLHVFSVVFHCSTDCRNGRESISSKI